MNSQKNRDTMIQGTIVVVVLEYTL
jgi:hypothetical protein